MWPVLANEMRIDLMCDPSRPEDFIARVGSSELFPGNSGQGGDWSVRRSLLANPMET
jgi:hypothetical protein